MQDVRVENTRNFALVGHSGDGKTSLGEAMLQRAGITKERGRVDTGNSVLNFLPEERSGHHTSTITSHLYSFDWDGGHFTLVDTPGDPNFAGDGEVAMQVLDGSIVVLNAVDGVKAGTARKLNLAADRGMPVLAFVSGLDRERADLDRALQGLTDFEMRPVLASLPIGKESELRGVVDLLHMRAVAGDGREMAIPGELADEVARARETLVETAAECDDDLIEKYLEEGELSPEDVVRGLVAGVRSRQLLPVFCGSGVTEVGVDPLLRAIAELLPSPIERGEWPVVADASGGVQTVKPDPDGPFTGLVFKTIIDRYAGTLSVLRVVSGRLRHDSAILDATSDKRERVGKIFVLRGEEHVEVPEAGPGDVVALAKLKEVRTGHALTEEKNGIHLPELVMPRGVLSYAVEAAARADEDKVFASLGRLAEEDPALHIGREPSTGEFLLTGMGELHIRTTMHKMQRLFNVEAKLRTPKVPYRETVTRRVEYVEGKLKKQTGGAGMFGVCYIDIEPRPRASGFEFEDKIVGGSIPRNLIPAVEKGVTEACQAGPLAGYPVVDIKVSCVDGKYHAVDSNEMAFKLAGSFALKAAVEKAGPVLLEPFMNVEVQVPDLNVGDVMGDIASRRGTVQTTETRGHTAVVKACVPMVEMLEYASTLTSLTGGKGEFQMQFSHYDQVPPKLAEKVIAEAAAERQSRGH